MGRCEPEGEKRNKVQKLIFEALGAAPVTVTASATASLLSREELAVRIEAAMYKLYKKAGMCCAVLCCAVL
jgi:hypothetical protein